MTISTYDGNTCSSPEYGRLVVSQRGLSASTHLCTRDMCMRMRMHMHCMHMDMDMDMDMDMGMDMDMDVDMDMAMDMAVMCGAARARSAPLWGRPLLSEGAVVPCHITHAI